MAKKVDMPIAFTDCIEGKNELGTQKKVVPTKTIKEHEYSYKELAALADKDVLAFTLKKERNVDAKGGKEMEVLKLDATTLVVRKEYVAKSYLLVIMPQKDIYKIYHEQTGEVLLDMTNVELENKTTLRKFFQGAPNPILKYIYHSDWVFREELLTRRYNYAWGGDSYDYKVTSAGSYDIGEFNISNVSRRKIIKAYCQCSFVYRDTWTRPGDTENSSVFDKNSMKLGSFISHRTPESLTDLVLLCLTTLNTAFKKSRALYKTTLSVVSSFIRTEYATYGTTSAELWEVVGGDINVLRNLINDTVVFQGEVFPRLRALKAELGDRYSDLYRGAALGLIAKLKSLGITKLEEYFSYLVRAECVILDLNHYCDVLEQAKALNNGKLKEKYPENWSSWSHKVQHLYRKHAEFIKSKKTFTYSDAVESLEHITDDKKFDYIIKLPRTYGDIMQEGAAMHHCVAGYADGIFNGDRLVMFIRSKDNPDLSLGTIDFTWLDKDKVSTYSINQCKGPYNRDLPLEVVSYLYKYMDIKKIKNVEEVYVQYMEEAARNYKKPKNQEEEVILAS